jgi:hypothetical protein
MANVTACRRPAFACKAQQQISHQSHQQSTPAVPLQRRGLLGGLAAAAVWRAMPASAAGIESLDLPQMELPEAVAAIKARQQGVLDDAEKVFQESGGAEGRAAPPRRSRHTRTSASRGERAAVSWLTSSNPPAPPRPAAHAEGTQRGQPRRPQARAGGPLLPPPGGAGSRRLRGAAVRGCCITIPAWGASSSIQIPRGSPTAPTAADAPPSHTTPVPRAGLSQA